MHDSVSGSVTRFMPFKMQHTLFTGNMGLNTYARLHVMVNKENKILLSSVTLMTNLFAYLNRRNVANLKFSLWSVRTLSISDCDGFS